jgi:hypothetical protein
VTPFFAETCDAVTASVDDGLAGHAGGFKLRGEESNELLLVLRFVPLGVGRFGEFTGGKVVRVPASDVSGDTTNLLGAAGRLVDGSKLLGTGLCVKGQLTERRGRKVCVLSDFRAYATPSR